MKALVPQLESTLCIDTARVMAEGFSMGGSMSYAVACAMPDVFRAVAVHSGGPMSGCVTHNKPVAYFMTHGEQDGTCTYPSYGVPELKDFSMVDGCMWPNLATSTGLPAPTGATGTHECVDFAACMSGYPVRSCIFSVRTRRHRRTRGRRTGSQARLGSSCPSSDERALACERREGPGLSYIFRGDPVTCRQDDGAPSLLHPPWDLAQAGQQAGCQRLLIEVAH